MLLREQVVPRVGYVGRYAPSPTGDLHLGNLRTALLAWQQAREADGIFILRVEDIDTPRNVPGSEQRIIEDLRWLEIEWDEGPDFGGPAAPYRQSDRDHYYTLAMHELAAAGLVYPCRCSRKDLQSAPSAPQGPEGPIYPGTCRPPEVAPVVFDLTGNCSWRFRVDVAPEVSCKDNSMGPQHVDLSATHGDFVVRRRDGLWAYQLACAVDDGLMGVTDVVRGADLLTSTPRQIALLQALKLPVPTYVHVPLMLDQNGQKMSKRDGSISLRSLLGRGFSPVVARQHLLMGVPPRP